MSRYLLLSTISFLFVIGPAAQGFAEDFVPPPTLYGNEKLKPRIDVGVKGGNKRSLLSTQIWIPLAQEYDKVLYVDARLMGDNDSNREGNLGFGYREMNDATNSIIGVHGWIDRRRTENNSNFHQFTFGAESLGHDWDVRANGYIPLNNARQIGAAGTTDPYLAGNGLFYDINGFLNETPQYGFDGEIGYRLPFLQENIDAVRVYGGGYHFFRNNTKDVTGFRVRTDMQVNSAMSFGGRFQYDEPRGSQGFLEATFRFPFGAKQLYQKHGLRSRMDESAERDVDIVTANNVTAGQKQVAVINRQSGSTQRMIHVNNTNADPGGGDGSLENPFNTLAAAEAIMQANDVIYINHGDGFTTGMDQGIHISHTNVSLIGSGSDFIWDNGRFASSFGGVRPTNGTIIAPATNAPLLTNIDFVNTAQGHGVRVTADNAYISGITVDSAVSHGIILRVEDPVDTIFVNTITINNVFVTNNGSNGLAIFSGNNAHFENVKISNVLTTHNQVGGIQINANQGSMKNVSISHVESFNNGGRGIHTVVQHGGSIDNVHMSHIKAHDNGEFGLSFYSTNASDDLTVSIQNSTITGNHRNGIYFNNDSVFDFNIDLGGGDLNSAGHNSIFGNGITNPAIHKDVRLDLNGGTISAQHNYWGPDGFDPDQVRHENPLDCPASCGTAITDPYLTVDPL